MDGAGLGVGMLDLDSSRYEPSDTHAKRACSPGFQLTITKFFKSTEVESQQVALSNIPGGTPAGADQ